MLKKRLSVWLPTLMVCLSLVSFGFMSSAHATEECWVDLAEPYGVVNVADANALINGYLTLGGFDFDQDGQPEFDDHNGDGVYNLEDVYGIWYEYVDAWYDAHANGCAPVQQSETIPPSGGFVATGDYSAAVVVPSGVLPEATEVSVTTLTDGPFTNWGEFTAYEFGPDGMQFAEPVRLYISYAGMNVGDPQNLRIVTYVAGEWQPVETISVDTVNQYVIGLTTHFSTYALTTESPAVIGQSCSSAGNQMRLPAWNKDKFLQSNRTCGVNGRGAIVANCDGDWAEVVWTDEDPVTDDHLSSVHADDTRHRCWWRSGGTHKTGEECEIPVPAPDRTEAAPEDWYIVNHPTESFTCYDLDECVAGATCDSGICGLIDVTETGDERIRVADKAEWNAADLDGDYLRQKYGCVCNDGYIPDGKGGCELLCEPGYKNSGDDVCVLDCPENEVEYGGECVLACALNADPDSLCAVDQHCVIADPPGIGTCVTNDPCEGYADCGAHGQCDVDEDNTPFCACDDGWQGDGTHCDWIHTQTCVRVVSSSAPNGGDGLGWETAMNDLQDAIDQASFDGCQVWVKAGSYPVFNGSPNDTIKLKTNAPVYGGFAGLEGRLEDRDWVANQTIITGENQVNHVLTANNGFVQLDGLIIEAGNGIGEGRVGVGAGLLISSTIAAGSVDNCIFRNNLSARSGGAIGTADDVQISVDLNIQNTTFKNNDAYKGGAISVNSYEGSANPVPVEAMVTISDCVFEDNLSLAWGAAVYVFGNGLRVYDSQFVRNNSEGMEGWASVLVFDDATPGDWSYSGLVIEGSEFRQNIAPSFPAAVVMITEYMSAPTIGMDLVFAQNTEYFCNIYHMGDGCSEQY